MKTIVCGYCEQEVSMEKRYWHRDGKWYPLYLHSACGVKIFEETKGRTSELWKYHKLGRKRTDILVSKEATNQAEHVQERLPL